MISIVEVHDFIRGILKKNYGAFVSPEDIDRAVNRAQYDLFDNLVRNYRQNNEFEYDHLFLKKALYVVSAISFNPLPLPEDYYSAIGIYYRDGTLNLHEGELLKWDAFIDRRKSLIAPPNITSSSVNGTIRPIATIYKQMNNIDEETGDLDPLIIKFDKGAIEFSPIPPTGSAAYILLYFKEPTKASLAYTTSNGNVIVSTSGHVDLDWDQRAFSDIVNRALMYLGFPIKDSEIIQLESIRDTNQLRDGNQ